MSNWKIACVGLLALIGVGVGIWLLIRSETEQRMASARQAAQTAAQAAAVWQGVSEVCGAQHPVAPAAVAPGAKIAFFEGQQPRGVTLPPELLAHNKSDVTHVGCIGRSDETVATCSYVGGVTATRVRHDISVRLIELKSRAEIASWVARGPAPPECPAVLRRKKGDTSSEVLSGGRPSFVDGLFRVTGLIPTTGSSPLRSR